MEVQVHCSNTGIDVKGARSDIGSCCDTNADSLSSFLRIAEHWWNTYTRESKKQNAHLKD